MTEKVEAKEAEVSKLDLAPNVFAAIRAVMESIGKLGIAKDRKNQQQGYSFRGIDDVYNELNPLLAGHGLIILPTVIERGQVERATIKGGALFYTTVLMDFRFVSTVDGSSITVRTAGEAMDSGDKSTNKAMSAAYKYACMQAFCIPTEGANDEDSTTHTVAAKEFSGGVPTKTATRTGFQKFCEDVHSFTTWDALDAWRNANAKAFAALNPELANKLKHTIKAKEFCLDILSHDTLESLVLWRDTNLEALRELPEEVRDFVSKEYTAHKEKLTIGKAAA